MAEFPYMTDGGGETEFLRCKNNWDLPKASLGCGA